MKQFILLAAFVMLASACAYPQVSYDCRLPDCIEGTPIDFKITFGATSAELNDTEKWKPSNVFYHDITINANGGVLAAVDQEFNITESNDTEDYEVNGLVPSVNGSLDLEICFNKSVYGQIYALNTGIASGINAGVVHSRNTFLFTWSKYAKNNRSCELIGSIDVIPRASVECVSDSDCADKDKCDEYECISVSCEGKCPLVINHSCVQPECCDSEACSPGKQCVSNKCKPLACNENQVTEEHSCKDINCWFFEKRDGQGCTLDWLRVLVIVALAVIIAMKFNLFERTGIRPEKKWYHDQ